MMKFQKPRRNTNKRFQQSDVMNKLLHTSMSWKGNPTKNSFSELMSSDLDEREPRHDVKS